MLRPGLVTLEVQDDEAVAFGPVAALVAEWCELVSLLALCYSLSREEADRIHVGSFAPC